VTTGDDGFGTELRRLRQAARLSLSELAREVHYSKGYLSKIEAGARPANIVLARLCDAVLCADGRLASLVPAPDTIDRYDIADDIGESGQVEWTMTLGSDGASRFALMPRRDVLMMGAATVLGLGAAPGSLAAASRNDATLQSFYLLFDQTRQLGQTISPSVVLPSVITNTHALRELTAAAPNRARSGLLLLTARYAEYAGWMSQESGQDKAALWWTAQAVEMATAAGDSDLAAYALVRRALITLYRGDPIQTVELARQAQADPKVPARIRGLAAQREAQGHALSGDYNRCRRLLDEAAHLLAGATTDPDGGPIMGTSTVADPVTMASGWCLHDLGRPREAAEILDRELARVPRSAVRTRARFGARRALAYACAGEVDHACELAKDVIDAAQLVDSATVRLDLGQLARTLSRWHAHSSVRDVHPRLIAALRTSAA
jgi:transcriptional regulator with XRE-family HTH domain